MNERHGRSIITVHKPGGPLAIEVVYFRRGAIWGRDPCGRSVSVAYRTPKGTSSFCTARGATYITIADKTSGTPLWDSRSVLPAASEGVLT